MLFWFESGETPLLPRRSALAPAAHQLNGIVCQAGEVLRLLPGRRLKSICLFTGTLYPLGRKQPLDYSWSCGYSRSYLTTLLLTATGAVDSRLLFQCSLTTLNGSYRRIEGGLIFSGDGDTFSVFDLTHGPFHQVTYAAMSSDTE